MSSLKGVFEAPTARTQMLGTTLLAVDSKGGLEGEPFITLREWHAERTHRLLPERLPKAQAIPGPFAAPATTARCWTCW